MKLPCGLISSVDPDALAWLASKSVPSDTIDAFCFFTRSANETPPERLMDVTDGPEACSSVFVAGRAKCWPAKVAVGAVQTRFTFAPSTTSSDKVAFTCKDPEGVRGRTPEAPLIRSKLLI